MRMWFVNPMWMCRQHLLGEHVELHMFFTEYFIKHKRLSGYITRGLFDPTQLQWRHDIIAQEMTKRGYNHRTPLPEFTVFNLEDVVMVDYLDSKNELLTRCSRCLHLYKEQGSCNWRNYVYDNKTAIL